MHATETLNHTVSFRVRGSKSRLRKRYCELYARKNIKEQTEGIANCRRAGRRNGRRAIFLIQRRVKEGCEDDIGLTWRAFFSITKTSACQLAPYFLFVMLLRGASDMNFYTLLFPPYFEMVLWGSGRKGGAGRNTSFPWIRNWKRHIHYRELSPFSNNTNQFPGRYQNRDLIVYYAKTLRFTRMALWLNMYGVRYHHPFHK